LQAQWCATHPLQLLQASSNIMRALGSCLTHGALMEKAGLDEVFVDVTAMVDAHIAAAAAGAGQGVTAGGSASPPTHSHLDISHQWLQQLSQEVQGYSVIEGAGVDVDVGASEADARLVVGGLWLVIGRCAAVTIWLAGCCTVLSTGQRHVMHGWPHSQRPTLPKGCATWWCPTLHAATPALPALLPTR
jgi:hypothetical protein